MLLWTYGSTKYLESVDVNGVRHALRPLTKSTIWIVRSKDLIGSSRFKWLRRAGTTKLSTVHTVGQGPTRVTPGWCKGLSKQQWQRRMDVSENGVTPIVCGIVNATFRDKFTNQCIPTISPLYSTSFLVGSNQLSPINPLESQLVVWTALGSACRPGRAVAAQPESNTLTHPTQTSKLVTGWLCHQSVKNIWIGVVCHPRFGRDAKTELIHKHHAWLVSTRMRRTTFLLFSTVCDVTKSSQQMIWRFLKYPHFRVHTWLCTKQWIRVPMTKLAENPHPYDPYMVCFYACVPLLCIYFTFVTCWFWGIKEICINNLQFIPYEGIDWDPCLSTGALLLKPKQCNLFQPCKRIRVPHPPGRLLYICNFINANGILIDSLHEHISKTAVLYDVAETIPPILNES